MSKTNAYVRAKIQIYNRNYGGITKMAKLLINEKISKFRILDYKTYNFKQFAV